jgi:uroporphyrin-III C-methyltransferase / precorrin-2 dehydrogenase / sirohydrochlorin ferrochelatase
MHSLPVFVRLQGRPVILLGDGEAAGAKRVLLERAGARIVGEAAEASLAIVAIDDEADALAAIARLKARGVLVNATDRAEHCDFTLPAIIDREPVILAIGTGGASAGLAKALRQRLELLLPQSLGGLAKALESARGAMRRRWPEGGERRKAVDAALDPGGALDCLGPADANSVARWLESDSVPSSSGLKRFELGSDDPDQLTLELARLLGQADHVVHSAGIAPAILARARADAARILADIAPDPLPAGLTVQLVRSPAP